ncbi:TPA: hypothetical protein KBN74_004414 [Citrobacter freundii]|nr:hypothetical protein [Citrobacter freundii]HBB4768067.1 hypothetical protein [Citrobacter freundii]
MKKDGETMITLTKGQNNHPANGPVSLDRLHQIREILSKAAAQSDGGNLGYAMADAVKVIDVAIAAFDAEPVAWWTGPEPTPTGEIESIHDHETGSHSIPLYPFHNAPPAPVVPDEIQKLKDGRGFKYVKNGIHYSVNYANGWNQCRAATLQAGNHTEQYLDMVDHSGDASEKGKDGTLINEGTIPAMQIKPVADLYGITSPTGSETTFTFDAGEASSFVGSGWTVQEYVELERYQEAITGK